MNVTHMQQLSMFCMITELFAYMCWCIYKFLFILLYNYEPCLCHCELQVHARVVADRIQADAFRLCIYGRSGPMTVTVVEQCRSPCEDLVPDATAHMLFLG